MGERDLPSWIECVGKESASRTALERFIYDQEPAGTQADEWREQLAAAIAEAKAQGDAIGTEQGDAMSSNVTLEQLRAAIYIYVDGAQHEDHDCETRRADAWRTVANWLLQYCSTEGDQYVEFQEGMRLVREKLR